MSRIPGFVRTEQSIAEVAEAMREHDLGFLPICDADLKVLGAETVVTCRKSCNTSKQTKGGHRTEVRASASKRSAEEVRRGPSRRPQT